jgi:hypothetical protein
MQDAGFRWQVAGGRIHRCRRGIHAPRPRLSPACGALTPRLQIPGTLAASMTAGAEAVSEHSDIYIALTGACRARHCAGNDSPASRPAPHNADAGHPPRHTVQVHLSTPRGRPPACHRRGRSPSLHLLATPPMVRRSGASQREATQKAGASGRHGHHRQQRPAAVNSASRQRQETAAANSDSGTGRGSNTGRGSTPPLRRHPGAESVVTESPCHLERSGLRGRAVERSPDGTKRSIARGAPPDLWGPFDSFADSLAQGDMFWRFVTRATAGTSQLLALTGRAVLDIVLPLRTHDSFCAPNNV